MANQDKWPGARPSEASETSGPSPKARAVGGSSIEASWYFESSAAPPTFRVAVVEKGTDRPVALAGPIRVERRDAGALVEWVATLTTTLAPSGVIELRPSAGEPVEMEGPTAAPAFAAFAAPPTSDDALVALQTLLDQQPDNGEEILRAMHPSADPAALRAALRERLAGPPGPGMHEFALPFPFAKAKVDPVALEGFVTTYGTGPLTVDEVKSQRFQTMEDWERYLTAPGAIAFTAGGHVQAPDWRKLASPALALAHDLRDDEAEDGKIEMALFADNGNPLHSSLAIAKQIVDSNLPYAFHLGDVYYGGGAEEFEVFDGSLRGMFDRTELFMLTGNHEMFAKGAGFQRMIAKKREEHPGRQRQNGEMFCLRGRGFQVIGIDTMFVGWDSGRLRVDGDFADDAVLDVLNAWLAVRPDDLTILLTTNQPWDLGGRSLSPLYDSLRASIEGRVDLWFWGNVHYAALYEPYSFRGASPDRMLVGSCIGHGGYPFYTQERVGALPHGVRCRWLEKKSRFWPEDRVRPDVGANGWCKLGLQREEDRKRWRVTLTYIDWVGRERLRADLVRDDAQSIRFESVEESDEATVGSGRTFRPVDEG